VKRIAVTLIVTIAFLILSATAASARQETVPAGQNLEELWQSIFQPVPNQPKVDSPADLTPGWEEVDHCTFGSSCIIFLCECAESCPDGVAQASCGGHICICN